MQYKKKKKVLIITYYWPPSGGPGVQRVLKFVKYLIRENWDVIVMTVDNGEYPAIDLNLEKEIPKECLVYKTKSFELFQLFKKITGKKNDDKIDTFVLGKKDIGFIEKIAQWVRLNLIIPDARVGWKRYGIKAGNKIIKEHKPDIIFSSSPPHSLQLIAKKLASKSGIPWVADYRDPWTKAFWESNIKKQKWFENISVRLEEKTIEKADRLVTVSNGAKHLLSSKKSNDFHVITNGFDHEDYDGLSKKSKNKKFRIVYSGGIARSQCPDNLIIALGKLPKQIQNKIQIDFYGRQDNYLWQIIEENNINQICTNHGYVSHQVVIQNNIESDMLLLMIPKKNGFGIMTGKLYEYLATSNFILGFGEEDSEAAEVINICKAGKMINYDIDPTNIILTQLDAWENNINHQSYKKEVDKYTRQNITQSLIKVFESCL